MKVAICGLTASGKSYHAKRIATEFGLEYVSGSDVLVEVAGIKPRGEHFWINEFGKQFIEHRSSKSSIDRLADELILKEAENGKDVVFDSWTLPWLYGSDDLYKIYLNASLEARAKMAYNSREQKPYSLSDIKERIRIKDETSARIFRELHGIDIFYYSIFDLVVDNSNLSPANTSEILIRAVIQHFRLLPPLPF